MHTGTELADQVPLGETWRPWTEAALRNAAPGWIEMVEELAQVQNALAGSAPPAEIVAEATNLLRQVKELLQPHAADDPQQVFGRLLHLPTRGQSLTPPLQVTSWTDDELIGETTFGRFHAGSYEAALGGAIALVFDDALGRLADMGKRTRSRTASLCVDYRSVTPVGRPLKVRAVVTEEIGRKRRLHGEILDGDRVCAEATGLFIAVRPGQP
jgi:acyl-coenzyme A thioesterase PaaI-like protein